jgi:hypothetical protein
MVLCDPESTCVTTIQRQEALMVLKIAARNLSLILTAPLAEIECAMVRIIDFLEGGDETEFNVAAAMSYSVSENDRTAVLDTLSWMFLGLQMTTKLPMEEFEDRAGEIFDLCDFTGVEIDEPIDYVITNPATCDLIAATEK